MFVKSVFLVRNTTDVVSGCGGASSLIVSTTVFTTSRLKNTLLPTSKLKSSGVNSLTKSFVESFGSNFQLVIIRCVSSPKFNNVFRKRSLSLYARILELT